MTYHWQIYPQQAAIGLNVKCLNVATYQNKVDIFIIAVTAQAAGAGLRNGWNVLFWQLKWK